VEKLKNNWYVSVLRSKRSDGLFLFIFEVRSYFVAQAALKLTVVLPQPPECWVYRCVPPCPTVYSVLM
jgi:hypothetical protein